MQPRPRSLKLEPLEDRTVLSTCLVTRLSDSGAGMGLRGDLRYCINKVNAEPGPDTIRIVRNGTINLTAALPNIASDIVIQGAGADLSTIDAAQTVRIFTIDAGTAVNVSDLTLRNGRALNNQPGGAIHNSGNLFIQDCTIANNKGWHYGGAIYNGGTLRIANCDISENDLGRVGLWNYGGGIFNAENALLSISRSTIRANEIDTGFSAVATGGGIANEGRATVTYSTISENVAHTPAVATIGGSGGGIYNGGVMTVQNSLIAANVASGDFWAYGGGVSNGYLHHINNGNYGYVPGGPMTIINCTIVDNTAYGRGDAGSGESHGGGVSSVPGSSISIRHTTIAGNHSVEGAGYVQADGGGIFTEGSTFELRNTIAAGNAAADAGTNLHGTLTTSDYNLFQNSAGGSGYGSNDILDVDPMLGPLQDNGGPTLTMALLPGSPAIDAGDNTDAPEFDQRGPGFPRIVNGTIDIGAFEVQSTGAPSQTDFLAFLITAKSDEHDWEAFP